MGQVIIVNHGTITDRQAFDGLLKEAVAGVEAELPGTLSYEFYVDEDGTRFLAHESYADSAAILAHLGHLTENGIPQRMMSAVTFDAAFVLGDVSAEVRQALEPMGFHFAGLVERARG
jgi:quinol monooxygenase YgiN